MNPAQDAFAALRYRDFSIVTLNQFCLTLAILIQEIIVAYSLYQLTKDPLTLGFIGLAEAIPFIALSLWGGYLRNPSYFIATVSENTEEQMRNYIKSQKER